MIQIFSLILALLSLACGKKASQDLPVVKARAWADNRYYGDSSGERTEASFSFRNETLYVVPASVGQVVLECNASYPVAWDLMESSMNAEMFSYMNIRTIRSVRDIFDPKSFNYSTLLYLGGPGSNHKFTGNYVCESTAKEEVQKSLFLFWQAAGSETLVHSKETLTQYIGKDEKLTLPCSLSSAKLKVPKLLKVREDDKEIKVEIQRGKNVSYDHKVGFVLSKFPNPVGTYKCLGEEDEDFVLINVKNSTTKPQTKPGANFTFNHDTNEVECCSAGKRPPRIFILHCDHAVTCQFREHVIEPFHLLFMRSKKKGKNCASKMVRLYHTVVVRCIGDGVDEYKEMISPVKRLYESYWKTNATTVLHAFESWQEIEPQEMLEVRLTNTDRRWTGSRNKEPEALYHRQQVMAECVASSYYFSEGSYWAIKWKDGKITPKASDINSDSLRYSHHLNTVQLTLESGMDAVLCFAPVWNSSAWITKTKFLYVNESVVPFVLNNETEELGWQQKERQKRLDCEAKGTPLPWFRWKQNGKEIKPSSLLYNLTETRDNSSVKGSLFFSPLGSQSEGEFLCEAVNYAGSSAKIFKVKVAPPSSPTTLVVILVTLFILVGLGGVIFLGWKKVRANHASIQKLAAMQYQNAVVRDQGVVRATPTIMTGLGDVAAVNGRRNSIINTNGQSSNTMTEQLID